MNNMNNKTNDWSENDLSAFKKRVMRRIYFSWFLKKVLVPAFVILPITVILLIKELSSVAVGNILGTSILKLSSFNFIGLFNYFIAAIRFTELDSLLVTTSSLLLTMFFGRKIIKDFYLYLVRDSVSAHFVKIRR